MTGGDDSATPPGRCGFALRLDATMLRLLGEDTDNSVRAQDLCRCQGCAFLFCEGPDSAIPVVTAALHCGMAPTAI